MFWEESERRERDGEWYDDITEHRDRRHILHYKIPVYQFQVKFQYSNMYMKTIS